MQVEIQNGLQCMPSRRTQDQERGEREERDVGKEGAWDGEGGEEREKDVRKEGELH